MHGAARSKSSTTEFGYVAGKLPADIAGREVSADPKIVALTRGSGASELFAASPDDLCEMTRLLAEFRRGVIVCLDLFVPARDGSAGRKSAGRTPEQVLAMGRIFFMIEVAAVRPLLRGCGERSGPSQGLHAVFGPVSVVRVQDRLHGWRQRFSRCGSSQQDQRHAARNRWRSPCEFRAMLLPVHGRSVRAIAQSRLHVPSSLSDFNRARACSSVS